MKVEEEKSIEFPIIFLGEKSTLTISIFMDDIDFPDVYFYGEKNLIKEVDYELEKFAKDHEI